LSASADTCTNIKSAQIKSNQIRGRADLEAHEGDGVLAQRVLDDVQHLCVRRRCGDVMWKDMCGVDARRSESRCVAHTCTHRERYIDTHAQRKREREKERATDRNRHTPNSHRHTSQKHVHTHTHTHTHTSSHSEKTRHFSSGGRRSTSATSAVTCFPSTRSGWISIRSYIVFARLRCVSLCYIQSIMCTYVQIHPQSRP
jgi:hypothetical protein